MPIYPGSPLRVLVMQLSERIASLDRLMEAKFVTYRTLIDSQADKVKLALDASKEAINKAEIATQKAIDKNDEDVRQRFASVNEFRGALADSQNNNVSRTEFDQFRAYYAEQHIILRDQHAKEISDLKGRLDRSEGRSGGFSGAWGYLVGAVGLVGAVVALVFRNM